MSSFAASARALVVSVSVLYSTSSLAQVAGAEGVPVFHGGPLEAGFPVVLGVDVREIAGRKVEVDAGGKLLPWPMAGDVGYSYAGYALSQWTVLQDQLERQKLPWARRDAAGNVHYLLANRSGPLGR